MFAAKLERAGVPVEGALVDVEDALEVVDTFVEVAFVEVARVEVARVEVEVLRVVVVVARA